MKALDRRSCPVRPMVTFHEGPAASEGVETDPSQRYLRYPLLLGRGACKRVYKAFDQVEGIEVAWNQVELSGSDLDAEARERLFAEIRVLQTLKHRNIMRFYDWWYDASTMTINFITEYFTSGNLRQYRKKHKHISEQAIKRWAFQILEGLMYLHAHDPPIVHRDLKCDNILVNGTSGQVKIADLGLASCQRGLSVVGTPEFMAPEIYDEVYDEKVDIYSFGMCMLELATLEYPYSECRSIPAIFRKVSQGIPPAALAKVTSQPLREFITTCIDSDPHKRPQALQLLRHEFFDSLKPGGSNADSSKHGYLTIPFGSCGNLQGLGVSGTHSRHQSFGRTERPKTLSCAECTAVARAAKAAADEQAEEEAAARAKAASNEGSEAGQCVACGAPVEGIAGSSGAGASGQQQVQRDGPAAAMTVIADSGFTRGRSICLAALNRSEPEAYAQACEEDSDDEVLVSIEDVLQPHPEDLLDPDTSHLHSTLRHTSSGCTIVSGPNCNLETRLSELSMSGFLDPACLGSFTMSSPQASSAAAARLTPDGGISNGGSRPVSATDRLPAADSASTPGQASRSSGNSFSSIVQCQSPDSSRQPSASAFGGSPAHFGSLSLKPLLSHSSDASALAAALNSRSNISSATAFTPGQESAGFSPERVLNRSVSSFSAQRSRGDLAAAGLLQMSPGVFLPTPSLLEKLLSRNGRPAARRTVAGSATHRRCSSTISGANVLDAEQQQHSIGPVHASSPHGQLDNGLRTCSCAALITSGSGSTAAQASMGVAADQSVEQGLLSLGGGLGQDSMVGQRHLTESNNEFSTKTPIINQQLQALKDDSQAWGSSADDGGSEDYTYTRAGSISFDGGVVAAGTAHDGRYISTPDPLAGSLGAASDLPAATAAAAPAAEGKFGFMVVRRRFAPNQQKQATGPKKRSNSL